MRVLGFVLVVVGEEPELFAFVDGGGTIMGVIGVEMAGQFVLVGGAGFGLRESFLFLMVFIEFEC